MRSNLILAAWIASALIVCPTFDLLPIVISLIVTYISAMYLGHIYHSYLVRKISYPIMMLVSIATMILVVFYVSFYLTAVLLMAVTQLWVLYILWLGYKEHREIERNA